ncbi:MAG: HAMP domain-containing sensor histidine kinase, partial [Bacteroidota bacterium]
EIEQKQRQIVSINNDLKISRNQLKTANSDLKNLNTKLNQILLQRTSELNKTSEELDTFFYQSSHALRRPLVHFKGLLEVLKLERSRASITEIYEKLDYTFHKMDVMLSKLVMASEINLEKDRDELVDFKRIIGAVWDYLGLKYNTEDLELQVNIDSNLTYYGNNKLVEIFFQNLMENSINFRAIPELRKSKISINITEDEDKVSIVFYDNGIGIPQKQLKKVFRMFIVASHLTAGFGLGLYIVSKAIKKLDGDIKVKSLESEYTTFEIVLPKNKGFSIENIKLIEKDQNKNI